MFLGSWLHSLARGASSIIRAVPRGRRCRDRKNPHTPPPKHYDAKPKPVMPPLEKLPLKFQYAQFPPKRTVCFEVSGSAHCQERSTESTMFNTDEFLVTEPDAVELDGPKPNAPEPVDTDEQMSPAVVNEVIARVGTLFDHGTFAVCGLAAMVYYGFTARSPTQVTIICPGYSQKVFKCWAIANGMYSFPNSHNTFGITTADGIIRKVRVNFWDGGFENLQTVQIGGNSHGSVLALPSLADQIAQAYAKELQFSAGRQQAAFKDDMVWVLRSIIKLGAHDQLLTPRRCPQIVDETFWIPFTLSYPETTSLFTRAGLQVDEYGSLMVDDFDYTSTKGFLIEQLTEEEVQTIVTLQFELQEKVTTPPNTVVSKTS
ncbi:hypothetical protein G7046_g8879 [Stylonectria norvegica]|nr:hypothetical protein G7046_g8879 [Stylonectria norvegica]